MNHDHFVEEQVAKILKKVTEKIKKDDNKKKEEGMKFKASGWIHLKSGRKRSFSLYFPENPSDQEIKEFLKQKRSKINDNYKIVDL